MLSQWLTVISGLVPGGLIYLPQVTAAGLQGWGTRPAMCRVQWVSPLLALLGRQGRLGIVVLRVSLGGPCDLLATRNAGRGEAQEMERDRN